MYSLSDKQTILRLAKNAIEFFLDNHRECTLSASSITTMSPALLEVRACFVTLKKNIVELRGCVGHLEAFQPLCADIIQNATAAAFRDDRFFPITKEELPEIEIEVSVLTTPKKLDVVGEKDILECIKVGVDGVIVKKGTQSATYVPQVWDEMLEKHNFLSSLCLKAGLEPDDWQKPGVEVYTYQVEIIGSETLV